MVNQKEELISTTHPTAHSAKENLSFIIITGKKASIKQWLYMLCECKKVTNRRFLINNHRLSTF